jgi:XapX domain-containing protein
MRAYFVSLGVGLVVGMIYGLIDVRSPAPPVIALVGLLGMLLGEQVAPAAKRLVAGQPVHFAWIKSESVPHIFGHMPKASAAVHIDEKKERS